MTLRFEVEIVDEAAVRKLEEIDDTVFGARLVTMITRELRQVTNFSRHDVRVRELVYKEHV